MKGFNIPILVVLFVLPHYCVQRKTILRTNWGIHFDEIDSLISNTGISHYEHSFALPWPQVKYNLSMLLNCSKHIDWYILCTSINKITTEMNEYNFEIFSSASNTIDETELLVPQRMNYDNITHRKRRSFAVENVAVDTFTDLFHMPGHKDLVSLHTHLIEATEAIKENSEAVKQFNNDLSSTQCLLNNRISNLLEGLNNVESTITNVGNNINQKFQEITDDMEKIMNRTNYIFAALSYITTRFLSQTFLKHALMKELLEEAEHWFEGIVSLSTGYLSSLLVPVHLIAGVIQHIVKNVLSQSKYAQMKLISDNPLYYYKQKNIVVTMHENMLIVLLKFPLHHIGGLLKVYRTDIFPVPITAGLENYERRKPVDSYTLLENIPSYFAVASDGEYYTTLSEGLYESCNGQSIKICKAGMGSLQHSTSVSCISALFFDDKKGIQSACSVEYTKVPPTGTAIQLGDDQSFLIHGAFGGNDTWRLRCTNNNDNTQQSLAPCSMCRIKIPCFCTLGAEQFQITARMTECSKIMNSQQLPDVTYLYHANLVMITNLYPENEMAKLQGYEARINSLYPPLTVAAPDIVTSNWSKVVEKSHRLNNDYKKLVKTTNSKVIAFESKEDLLAKEVKNFSDVTVDRTTDLGKAISDAFAPFPALKRILGLLFSNLGISLLIFTVMSLKLLKHTGLCMTNNCRKSHSSQDHYVVKYSKLNTNNK